jgi:hypothetical protein
VRLLSGEGAPSAREHFIRVLGEHEERYGFSRRDLMYMELVEDLSSDEIDKLISDLLDEGIIVENEIGELKRV